MERVYRKIVILLLIFGFNISLAQKENLTFDSYTPKYTSENSPSLLICKSIIEFESIDSMQLKIFTNYIKLGDSLLVKTLDSNFTTKISNNLEDYEINIDSSYLSLIQNKIAIFYIPIVDNLNDEINFEISLFSNKRRIYKISSLEVNDEGEYLSPAIINPYKENPEKSQALKFNKNASFTFGAPLNISDSNKISLWTKTDTLSNFGVALLNPITKDTLLKIFTDKFGIFRMNNSNFANVSSEIFAFPNAWNNITLSINPNTTALIINSQKSIEKENLNSFPDSVLVDIYSIESNNNLFIKDIEIETKSYDSVTTLKKYNFEEGESFEDFPSFYDSKNCEIAKTEFPVLISPPEINISITSVYTTLEWFNNSDSDLKFFILQKSLGFGSFTDLYSVENPEKGKHYFYDDYNSDNKSVVFYRIKQIDKNDDAVYSRQVKVGKAKIKDFEVEQNYPNPFNPSTSIKINVIIPGYFQIGIYDLVGKEIAVLHQGTLTEGYHTFNFEPKDLPSGIYLLRVKSLNNTVVRKMIFTK